MLVFGSLELQCAVARFVLSSLAGLKDAETHMYDCDIATQYAWLSRRVSESRLRWTFVSRMRMFSPMSFADSSDARSIMSMRWRSLGEEM